MPTLLDYMDSVIQLEQQAISQADQGTRQGLKDAKESLNALISDCNSALETYPTMPYENRMWFEAKRDKAASALI